MKFCDYCGSENDDEASRCRECGMQEFRTRSAVAAADEKGRRGSTPPEPEWEIPGGPAICEWCGRKNAPGATSCYECGTSLKRRKPTAQTQPRLPEPQRVEPQPVRKEFRRL